MENIIKKSFKNLGEHFVDILLIIIVQGFVTGVIYSIFSFREDNPLLLFGGLIYTLLVGVLSDYVEVECYLAFREGRKIRPLGCFLLFKEYDVELLKLSILKNIKIFLWTLLFVFPGVYKSYVYNRVLIEKVDNYTLDSKEAFEKSSENMDGRKMQLFGYQILISLPLFISCITIFSNAFDLLYVNGINSFALAAGGIIVNILLIIIFAILTTFLSVSLNATFQSELTDFLNGNFEEELSPIEYEEEKDGYDGRNL